MFPEPIKSELLAKIDSAFKNSRYPGDHGIGGDEAQVFRGKWQELSLETMIDNRSAINDFSTEGFAYYLPSFLRAIIVYTDKVDTLTDAILFRLLPPQSGDRFLIKVLEELNAEQKYVIRDFLSAYAVVYKDSLLSDYVPNATDLERAVKYWTKAAASK